MRQAHDQPNQGSGCTSIPTDDRVAPDLPDTARRRRPQIAVKAIIDIARASRTATLALGCVARRRGHVEHEQPRRLRPSGVFLLLTRPRRSANVGIFARSLRAAKVVLRHSYQCAALIGTTENFFIPSW